MHSFQGLIGYKKGQTEAETPAFWSAIGHQDTHAIDVLDIMDKCVTDGDWMDLMKDTGPGHGPWKDPKTGVADPNAPADPAQSLRDKTEPGESPAHAHNTDMEWNHICERPGAK